MHKRTTFSAMYKYYLLHKLTKQNKTKHRTLIIILIIKPQKGCDILTFLGSKIDLSDSVLDLKYKRCEEYQHLEFAPCFPP